MKCEVCIEEMLLDTHITYAISPLHFCGFHHILSTFYQPSNSNMPSVWKCVRFESYRFFYRQTFCFNSKMDSKNSSVSSVSPWHSSDIHEIEITHIDNYWQNSNDIRYIYSRQWAVIHRCREQPVFCLYQRHSYYLNRLWVRMNRVNIIESVTWPPVFQI